MSPRWIMTVRSQPYSMIGYDDKRDEHVHLKNNDSEKVLFMKRLSCVPYDGYR